MDTTNAVRTRGYPPVHALPMVQKRPPPPRRPRVPPPPKLPGPPPPPNPPPNPPSVTPAAPAAQESAEDDPAEDRTANPAAPSLYTARTVPVPVRPHILFGQAPCLPGQRVGLMGLGQRTLWIVRADQLPGPLQPPLGLREPGPGLAADGPPIRRDVVRGGGDRRARGEHRLVEQGPGPTVTLLTFAGPGQRLVQCGIGLLHPAQRIDRVVAAGLQLPVHIAQYRLRAGDPAPQVRGRHPLRGAFQQPARVGQIGRRLGECGR